MKKVTILGFNNTMATTLFGPMDILNQAGRLWNRVNNTPQTPFFDVTIASADGQPVRCTNNVLIQPHCGIETIDQTDLIVIASATDIKPILGKNPGIVPWLLRQYDQGAHIASICTGVFLLAETGLLDGRSATLHWGLAKMFQKQYPRVNLWQDRMFIDHGRLYCSAGVNAGMDLTLYLVEKFCGRQNAVQSAKTMILDMGRTMQTPYESVLFSKDHGDPLVLKAQEWIEQHHTRSIDYDGLAREYRLSRRSLERRFKQATGVTPLGYLQQLRVESAKRMLEEGTRTFSEITYQVGYEDISFFRKVFVRVTGLRPKEYQQRFTGYADISGPSA
ncbi:MAG: helix-turn-helix domain-containing protein [Desulfobacteraceae bacterium]|nr:helix-turn-helix domain-containing protein [Desulfobacteraceae bacterium]